MASKSWRRLKPVTIDPLEAIGLPSKGDDRLLDLKAQEEYFRQIRDRYQTLSRHNDQSNGDLSKDLASLSLNGSDLEVQSDTTSPNSIKAMPEPRELSVVIQAMRKLREAIVATSRIDPFALEAYTFIVRATILEGHVESYHPALLHLLRTLLPTANGQGDHFIGYYILDLACRQDDLRRALEIRCFYNHKDPHVESLLVALVRGNWYLYWKARKSMSLYQKRLVQASDDRIRNHTLNCFASTYLSAERRFVEQATQEQWTDGINILRPSWTLEDDKVIIRRIKKK